jgi:hypothetical protein
LVNVKNLLLDATSQEERVEEEDTARGGDVFKLGTTEETNITVYSENLMLSLSKNCYTTLILDS